MPAEAKGILLFILVVILLGSLLLMVIFLRMFHKSMRRSSLKHDPEKRSQTPPVDPWQESGRRLQVKDEGEDEPDR